MKTICLIGRPNTGKSSLFNRILKEKKAIIMDNPGITRDRIYGRATFGNKTFHLIDTGGIDLNLGNFNEEIKVQAEMAAAEADVIIFLVDGLTDITDNDRQIASMLSRLGKKVIVAVNKIDNDKREENIYSFYELGFDTVIGISAEHNRNIDKLLALATEDFNENKS